jgi:hypothetical protein
MDKQTELKQALEDALIRNRAMRIFSPWLASISEALAMTVSKEHFLTRQETAALKTRFFDQVILRQQNREEVYYSVEDKETLSAAMHQLADTVVDLPSVLFSDVDRYIGAVRLPAGVILRNAFRVWELVKEDLSFVTEDLESGFCLEYNYYDDTHEFVKEGAYELTAWGRLRIEDSTF